MATSDLSNDTRNFQCVTVASVAVIKLPLRDILANHIQPQDLFQKIQSCSTLKLRPDQLKLCCIPPPDVPDYNKFDVTLLYTLIRNLCSLPRPAQGWGNEPTANDTQISDDIERLRLFRNNFYAHAESAVIADAVFKDVWKNLKLVFRRIQPKMGYSVDYEEELMNIERTKFTDDFLTNFRVLLETFAKLEIQTDGRDEPDIFIQGENEIKCGSTAQIKAEVKKVESSCWSITWRKRRGDNIKCIDTDMEKYSGSSKKTLVINSVCKEDEGEYQAVLSPAINGPEYKSRNTIRLHAVGEIPFLTISEVSLGSEGITIHFNCGVLEQSPKVHLIEWSKNGKQLDNKSNKYVGEGLDNRQLTITSPTYEDRGKYNCKVSNAVGSVSKNVMLDVPCVELLEVSPIFCGSKTTIKCVISSTPTPENIEWQTSRNGVDFQSIRRAKYFDNTDNSFVIHKATFADKLYYRLRVWNGIGETISNTVYLNVTGSPPNIKTITETNIKNRSVKLIGNVIIYDDSPGVKNYFWTRNHKTIDFEECNGRLSETRTDNPSLTITNVGPDDAGEYRLTAMNDVGSFTSEAIVLGVPRISEEKVEDEDNGGQRITVTIKSIPEPCHVQWSVKRKEDDTFVQIDIYAKEYEGTTVTLPHPVLFVKQEDQLENICFRIEVTNFIGNTQREISGNCTTKQRKIDSVENTIYNDDGKNFEFTILSSTLVKQFPMEKLDLLKFLIKNSNKVKNLTSVKEATSVLKCIEILQDEKLFTPTDVIYMQFLCQEADCFDLFTKCVEYAESKHRALCYYKKTPVNGYKDVQFHVQGDVSGYTKEYIDHLIKTVAVILRCKEEDVLLNGAQRSKSFLLSLSIKEPYIRKLLALEEQDRLKLRRLNIDYLIIDGEILDIEIPKDQGSGRKEQSSCEEVTPVPPLLHQEKNQPHGEFLEDSSDNWFTDSKMSVKREHNKDDKTDEDFEIPLSEYLIPPRALHYLVCGTEDCMKNCQFYCNSCHQLMCKKCRDEHQRNNKSMNHEIVPYRLRKRQLPVEKCKLHPTRYVDVVCEECQIPLCSKCCTTEEHRGHSFVDLEILFIERRSFCQEKINKIQSYFWPTSQNLKVEIARDVTEIKTTMEALRTSIKAEAESLKMLVDKVTIDNFVQVDKIEQSLLETLSYQNREIDEYINYLNDSIEMLYAYLSPSTLEQLKFVLKSKNLIRPIPETSQVVPPVFTAGQYSEEDVADLLGGITVPNTKPENRKIKPIETVSSRLRPTGKQRKQDREKYDVKHTLSPSFSVTKVREYTVPGVDNVFHITLGKSGSLWVSDLGYLVQTDLQGNQLQKIQTNGQYEGYHTVTPNGDLVYIYTDKGNKVINRIIANDTVTEFIKTRDWKPISIHSSHINGDILVGMIKERESKVTRFNKTGTEIQNIQRDDKGEKLYSNPHYITENINGDVCVSDYSKHSVVVVDKSGQHRFSYSGQRSTFYPFDLCTDVLGDILVCDNTQKTVHLLNKDGQFLSLLLTEQKGIGFPRSVCVDDENNLWVGNSNTNTVTVYKYMYLQ